MANDFAIKVESLSKCYQIYDAPSDRLKQFLFRNRRRYFKEFWALKDISFKVQKGEALGIIGRNGSGKSTLLQMICGTLNPSGGEVKIHGRVAALLELGAGFNPEFSGRENVYMNASLFGLTKDEIDGSFDRIAEFADIGEFLDQPVKTFSSGMYVRLAFAVAINVEPDILIIDEALAVGDIRFQLKCQRKLDELRSRGVTLLFVSHNGDDLVRLCTRAIWLDGGKVRLEGEPKKIVEEYLAWMVHDTEVIQLSCINDNVEHTTIHIDQTLIPVDKSAFITGDGGAEVVAVGLFSEDKKRLRVISGKEPVSVVIKIQTKVRIENPYFAFQVINAKGLRVMGSNNHVIERHFDPIESNRILLVSFEFIFPEIENGNYLLALGIADGTPDKHIRHQFIADAYQFQVLSLSPFQKQSVLLKLNDCAINLEIAD